jgi:hypothetical protein
MKEDLQIAFNWFTHPNGKAQSYLSPNGNQTMDAIRTALSTHSLEQARQIANHVTFNPQENPLEVGEILVWAAIYTLYLGEDEYIKFAKELFQNAAAKYSDNDMHYRAITMWLLGLIYWQFPEYKYDAIHHWEYSLRVLTHLSYSSESLNPGWYQKIRFQVIESLFHTRMFKRYLPIKEVKYFHITATKQQPSAATGLPTGKPKTSRRQSIIRSLPVYQYIPAGGWGVVDPEEIGQSQINDFVIDNILHQAIDLMGRGQITIQEREQYAFVRIKGTSMNKRDIQNGDYVLIHRQEDANHTDIVLAERIGIDPEATLKRLYKQGNNIELRPESIDPENPILPVDKWDNLRILGIAIAVLKPAPKESEENNEET